MIVPLDLPKRDVDYYVVVNDPLAVNQILREGVGVSTYQLADMLLKNGIAFRTLERYPFSVQQMCHSPPMPMFTADVPLGLGVCMKSQDTFTVDDYTDYLERREDVLQGPAGRAALLSGGVTTSADKTVGSSATSIGVDRGDLQTHEFVVRGKQSGQVEL